MNRRKIPLSAKRRQRAARVKILAEVGIYQRRLERLRAAQIRKSLSAVIDYPYQEWSARLEWDEPYIGKRLNNIYKLSSVNGSEKQLEEWGVKSSPVWQNTFDQWVKTFNRTFIELKSVIQQNIILPVFLLIAHSLN